MKRSQRRLAVCALASTGALVGTPASAQVVSGESTRLELRASAGCSSAADFTSRVARRSNRIHFISEPAARSLVVELQAAGQGFRGSVTLVEADGATRTRKLTAKTCEEAAEGLALIATVTLDPDALLAEPPAEPAPEPKPEPKPPRPKPPPRPKAQPPGPSDAPTARVSFGLAATMMVEVAPEIAPGGSLEIALEIHPGQVISPFIRLSVPHVERRGLDAGTGDVNFAFTLPTLDVCPVRLGSRLFSARPCAYASVGLLKAWGSSSLEDETHTRWFYSAGGALWLGLRVSEAIEIIADARAVVPLRRDVFTFDDVVFWRTPSLGFSSAIGVAGGFP